MKKKIIVSLSVAILIFVAFAGYMYMGMIRMMNNSDPAFWEKIFKRLKQGIQKDIRM